MGCSVIRRMMRAVPHKRSIVSYICVIGLFSVLLTLYGWGLKQHKQTGVKFNLMNPKVKRETYFTKDSQRDRTLNTNSIFKSSINEHQRGFANSYGAKGKERLKQSVVDEIRPEEDGQPIKVRPQRWDDLQQDLTFKEKPVYASESGGREKLHVYVVEEHHEGVYVCSTRVYYSACCHMFKI